MIGSANSLDAVFSALADPTRREILGRLSEGEVSVSALAEPFAISLPAISRHLSVLEDAGLLTREKQGRVRYCRLTPETMAGALAWIASSGRFWEERLDGLERYLAQPRVEQES